MNRSAIYTDAEIYEVYERLGSGSLTAKELGRDPSWINRRIRIYREDVLGETLIRKKTTLERQRLTPGWRPDRSNPRPRPPLIEALTMRPAEGRRGSQRSASRPLSYPENNVEPSPVLPEGNVSLALAQNLDNRFAAIERRMDMLLAAVDRILARPPMLVEWRPDHRRIKDGGVHVSEQRRQVALPQRGRR